MRTNDLALMQGEEFAMNNPEAMQMIQEQNNLSPYQIKRMELISKLQNKEISLSYSWLKTMLDSPRHFIEYRLQENRKKTEDMIFGSLVDCLITDEENFKNDYVLVTKFPSAGNQTVFVNAMISGMGKDDAFGLAYKRGNVDEIYEELQPYIECCITRKTPVTQQQLDEAKIVRDTLLENDEVGMIINSCHSFQEKSEIEYDGWKIKRFTDLRGEGLTVDLKLMSQLNPRFIDSEIFKMHYDLQSGVYTADNNDRFFNICYDRKGNYILAEYDEMTIQYGKEKLDYIIAKLEECCDNPLLFNQSYNFHDMFDETLGMKSKKIYKPGYAKSYRLS